MRPSWPPDAAQSRFQGPADRPEDASAQAPGLFSESALTFGCAGETLVGVLAVPAAGLTAQRTAVVIVVGGPQFRSGSHRQFTLLARDLAAAGWPTLRFDVRGMGDSTGESRSFETLDDDIAAAIGVLHQRCAGVDGVVLWGLCDGASAALLYLDRTADPRVRGLCLANPWVRSAEGLARTHVKHYYLQRLLQPDFWRKLLAGGVGVRAARELAQALRALWGGRVARQAASGGLSASAPEPDFRRRMLRASAAFDGHQLLALSGNDFTAKEFVELVASDRAWQSALARRQVQRLELPEADHTFSEPDDLRALHAATCQWLENGRGDAWAPPPSGAACAYSPVR